MNVSTQIDQYIEDVYPEVIQWRRYLHANPELSFQEIKTSAWLVEQLEMLGCDVHRCTQSHGIMVSIKGEESGPVIALRADMDALPIQDEKEVSYASQVPNVMHACGHDGHTSILLAIAKFYMQNRHSIKGERRLLFQPAEELAPGGAQSMINEGVLDGVDVVYGIHLWTPLPYGLISTKPGNFMSAVDDFNLEIIGRGGHGGMPQDTTDAIVIGAQVVQALQTIVSRNVNPINPAVVTVGTFQAGSANNVIAERCLIKGTIRTFDEETRQLIQERVKQIIDSTCKAFGAEYQFELKIGYPSVINDAVEAERVLSVARNTFGEQHVQTAVPIMIAEDFSFYLRKVPGCFMFVGAGKEECNAIYPHHHPMFDFDERAMKHGIRLLVELAESYKA